MAVSPFLTLALLAVFGVVPAVAGVWLIVVSRKKGLGFPGCGQCKYDLSGTLGTITRCPECGSDLRQVGVLPAQGRKNKGALTVGILLLCVPLLCIGAGLISMYAIQVQTAQTLRANATMQMQTLQATAAAQVMATTPDPMAVALFRQQHSQLSIDQAGYKLGEVGQNLAQAINDGDLENATTLRAEQQALIDLLNEAGKKPQS